MLLAFHSNRLVFLGSFASYLTSSLSTKVIETEKNMLLDEKKIQDSRNLAMMKMKSISSLKQSGGKPVSTTRGRLSDSVGGSRQRPTWSPLTPKSNCMFD